MKTKTFIWGPLVVAFATFGLSTIGEGAAHAGTTIKSIETVPVDPNYKAKEDELPPVPHIRAKIGTSAVGLKPSDFLISTDSNGKQVGVPGEKAVPFRDSEEELDMVILVQGTVRFMGDPNPEVNPGEDATEIKGYYNEVKQAIDTIAKARPKKTQVALYVYGDKTITKADFQPATSFTAESLGAQKDFSKITTKALIKSLDYAATTLGQKPGRRVLFLIGDGDDQDVNARITDVVKKLDDAGIEVYVLGANPQGTIEPKDDNRLVRLGKLGEYQKALQSEQVVQSAESLANSINNVYTVGFAQRAADTTTLPWDGQDHDLVVTAKKEQSEPKTWNLINVNTAPPPPAPSFPWLYVLLGVLGLAIVGIVVLMVFRKPKEEEVVEEAPPPPPPVMEAPPMPAPAPKQKTMMIGVGGDTDGMPVVGWIVPLAGPAQYQTFKLASRTTIGSSPDNSVCLADQFMSGHHAEILMSSGGFTLMDKGSANGIVVNGKRVPTHELVDNDVFTMGKTEFKFKSIN